MKRFGNPAQCCCDDDDCAWLDDPPATGTIRWDEPDPTGEHCCEDFSMEELLGHHLDYVAGDCPYGVDFDFTLTFDEEMDRWESEPFQVESGTLTEYDGSYGVVYSLPLRAMVTVYLQCIDGRTVLSYYAEYQSYHTMDIFHDHTGWYTEGAATSSGDLSLDDPATTMSGDFDGVIYYLACSPVGNVHGTINL